MQIATKCKKIISINNIKPWEIDSSYWCMCHWSMPKSQPLSTQFVSKQELLQQHFILTKIDLVFIQVPRLPVSVNVAYFLHNWKIILSFITERIHCRTTQWSAVNLFDFYNSTLSFAKLANAKRQKSICKNNDLSNNVHVFEISHWILQKTITILWNFTQSL